MREVGGVDVWLHVMAADDAAKSLYTSSRYVEVDPPSPAKATNLLGKMFVKPADKKLLMRRVLEEGVNAMPY